MFRYLPPICMCVLSLGLVACRGYDFKVNDKVVYTPAPLFSKFDIPDSALHACVEQAIIDNDITKPGQLTSLNCSSAGIERLEGLAIFHDIRALELSSNNIRNLVELTSISSIEILYLQDNRVVDPVPLYKLSGLLELNLSGNTELQCPRSNAFDILETYVPPQHCL